nr:protein PYRICULARIA ORYZAE RESISTANCE 21-like isoform X1 [Coffea arabica]
MRLKVDLQCPCCYKKVKKILCKFPQIRDQVYDEKQNLVTITVVCSSPEKIRDKLCCKGGKVIKSIEIVEPKPDEKPPVPEKPKKKPKPDEKPPVQEKPKKEPKPDEKPPVPEKPKKVPKPDEKPPVPEKPKPCSHPLVPVVFRCVPCLEGYGGGPCYCGYWRPMPLPRCYGSYGHGCGCGCGCGCRYGYGKGYWYSWCDYFSE